MMRRIAMIAAALCMLLAAAMPLWAASDKIGYLDPAQVLISHPKYAEAQKHLDDFVTKRGEALEAARETEKDPQKLREMVEEARRDSGAEELRIMNPINEEINVIIEKVARAKGIDVVLAKGMVYYGDADITDDVVKELKALKSAVTIK